MVALTKSLPDITVLCPTPSLARQLADWIDRHDCSSVRLVWPSPRHLKVIQAMAASGYCLIDVTERPEEAMFLLSLAAELIGPERVGVYTEVMHEGIELAVRRQGVAFVLGPMTEDEWRAFLPGPKPRASLAVS